MEENYDKIVKSMERVTALLNLAKVLLGSLVALMGAFAGLVIWVNSTNTAVAMNRQSVESIAANRKEVLAEWGKWREQKDAIDTRLVVLLENQQQMLRRFEERQDKIREAMSGAK